jgi:hypothetical protein
VDHLHRLLPAILRRRRAVTHHNSANDVDGPEATEPAVGTAARVEALERALAETAQQIADLRGRVEALETDNGKRGR